MSVLSTFCSSEAASILGLTACFPGLRVCFYYKQQSALQGSLYKIMIHLVWKHFFHFFSNVFLNLNQRAGLLAPGPGAELGRARWGAWFPAKRAGAVASCPPL